MTAHDQIDSDVVIPRVHLDAAVAALARAASYYAQAIVNKIPAHEAIGGMGAAIQVARSALGRGK